MNQSQHTQQKYFPFPGFFLFEKGGVHIGLRTLVGLGRPWAGPGLGWGLGPACRAWGDLGWAWLGRASSGVGVVAVAIAVHSRSM